MHFNWNDLKSPSMWAFMVGMFGSVIFLNHAETQGWSLFTLDHMAGALLSVVAGGVCAGLVIFLQDRFGKKAAPLPVPHHEHHHHECEHDHSH